MIIGELDLERAERDPAYLARVKAFLVRRNQATAIRPDGGSQPRPPSPGQHGADPELGLEFSRQILGSPPHREGIGEIP